MKPLTAKEFYEKELNERRELWEAGNYPALFEAVQYCHTVEIPMPEWLTLAVLNIIQDYFHAAPSGGAGGRHNSRKGRLQMDYAHFCRWSRVRSALVIHGLTELPEGRSGRPKPGTVTKASVLATAAEWLEKGTRASSATPREIEKSYFLVQASRDRGEKRFCFEVLLSPLS